MTKRKIDTIAIAYGMMINDQSMNEQTLARIRQAAPEAQIIFMKNKEDWLRQKAEFADRINVVFGLRPFLWYKEMPNLAWCQQTGAGANWLLDMPDVARSDMILTNASGVHAIPISEHILALMLSLSRGIHLNIRSQSDRKWDRRGEVLELDGATVGIIGLGAIGEKTAEKAKGLNMRVLGLRRNPGKSSPFVEKMFGPDGLQELLSQSDWVVLTAAMTAETRGMIGEAEFKAMKKTAFIINIARGPIIDEPAMIEALQGGAIAGAGLDVFETEPLPQDSPLWDMENVVITPHYAGATPRYMDRLLDIFTENLRRYQAGEPLINVVDKKLGY